MTRVLHLAALLTFLSVVVALSQGKPSASFSPLVDETGAISRPKHYQETMVLIGSYATSRKDDGQIDLVKGVYTRPEDLAAYREKGAFPDGAVLVKEVYQADSMESPAGRSHYAKGEPIVRFVMIKDRQTRFPDNPLWAEGWGWARFEPANWDQNVATDFRKDCRSCHEPAAKTDWIYAFAYPALHEE